MRIQYFFIPACIFLLTLNPVYVYASDAQQAGSFSHQQLMQSAADYVRQALPHQNDIDLRLQTSALDSRIVIPQCQSALSFYASPESLRQSNVTVKAACPDNNWYLYVMVKSQRIQQVIVASAAISPGELITTDNISKVEMDKNQIRSSTFANLDDLIGARLKRRVRPGQPITPNLLCFVCKGDSIIISAKMKGLNIKTKGVAQQDGNIGDTILVKNVNSEKLLHARVKNNQEVMVSI